MWADGSDYQVKVYSRSDTSIAGMSDAFTIGGQSITVTAPNGGETWLTGSAQTLTWTAVGDPDDEVKIELLKGGTLDHVIEYIVSASDGSFAWTVPEGQTAGADYTVHIYSRTNPGIEDTSDADFTIAKPAIALTAPERRGVVGGRFGADRLLDG